MVPLLPFLASLAELLTPEELAALRALDTPPPPESPPMSSSPVPASLVLTPAFLDLVGKILVAAARLGTSGAASRLWDAIVNVSDAKAAAEAAAQTARIALDVGELAMLVEALQLQITTAKAVAEVDAAVTWLPHVPAAAPTQESPEPPPTLDPAELALFREWKAAYFNSNTAAATEPETAT